MLAFSKMKLAIVIAAAVIIALALAVYHSKRSKKTVDPEPEPPSLPDLNLPSYATRGLPTTAPSTIVEQVNE